MTQDEVSRLRAHIQPYASADARRAAWVLAQTLLVPALALVLYRAGWTPLAIILDGGALLRLFMVYHDAIHGAYLSGRPANERLARWLQGWVLTPVGLWQKNHLEHHANFGNLNFHDHADTIFFTRGEFRSYPRLKRLALRVVRTPVVFFLFAPFLQWWVQYPLLYGNPWLWAGHALHLLVAWQVSWWHLAAVYLATIAGLGLFHLQHGVSRGYRAPEERWDFFDGALHGSTWLRVPWPLSWFTLGIEFHHIHHTNPRVPCYRLARCHREAPAGLWREVNAPGLFACLAAFRNVMWDEERGTLAPF